MHWHESTAGRHFELGIAETNLVGLLGELGATWSRYGQPLLPIGTIYDPFVGRALEPWSFGMYAGGQSILVDAERGVAGARGRGASVDRHALDRDRAAWLHRLGAGVRPRPRVDAAARARPPGARGGESAYFRLSTRPIDQALAGDPPRELALAGATPSAKLLDPVVTLVGMGAVLPDVLDAADTLGEDVDVICVTSADLLFRALRARAGFGQGSPAILDQLFPRRAPLRSSPCSTAIRTRSPSWPGSTPPR